MWWFVRIVIPRVEGGGMSKSKSCLRASAAPSHFFDEGDRTPLWIAGAVLLHLVCTVSFASWKCERRGARGWRNGWVKTSRTAFRDERQVGNTWEHDGTRGCFPLIHILASVSSTAEKLQDVAKLFIKICSYHGFVVRFQHQAAWQPISKAVSHREPLQSQFQANSLLLERPLSSKHLQLWRAIRHFPRWCGTTFGGDPEQQSLQERLLRYFEISDNHNIDSY